MRALRSLSRRCLAAALALTPFLASPSAHAGPKPSELKVAIERPGDLRLLALWVGIGNGDFRRQGLEIVPVVRGAQAGEAVAKGEIAIATIGPALWGAQLAKKADVALVAALLRDHGANVIGHRGALERGGVTSTAPLASRLDALREQRVGYVAADDPDGARLRLLLGDRAARVRLIELDEAGAEKAFAAGDVDAIFAPSPWAERALVSADGTLWIHASREAPPGALPILEAAMVSAPFAASDDARVLAFVRGITLAEQLIHDERAAAVHALVEALPSVDRSTLEAGVLLYEPAVPRDPRLDAEAVTSTLRATLPAADPAQLDLSRALAPSFAVRAVGDAPKPRRFMKIAGAVLGVVIGGIVTFMVLYRKKSNEAAGDEA